MDRYFYVQKQMRGAMEMKKGAFDEEMVECHFEGTIIPVPKKIFFEILLHVRLDGRKFVRYKDGAYIYSMSEREFY